jgi:hypothetical protein
MIDRKTRDELSALSKEVFGASSRWQKLMNDGVQELLTEEVTELVPGEKEGDEPTERKVWVPVKRSDGALQYSIKRYTLEEVHAYMLDLKKKFEEFQEQVRKIQEEAKKKKEQEELEKALQVQASGSAL